jgi:hypothetical protein
MTDSTPFAELLHANRHRLVPVGSPLPKIVEVKVGKKRFSRENIYHQCVSVTCDVAGKRSCLDLWVKHRPGIHEAFAPLDRAYKRLGEGVFPAPILEWHSDRGNSLLLTERIEGETLRNKLVKAAVLRRTATLRSIFASNGTKMRKFHDASEPCGLLATEELVGQVRGLVERTSFFSQVEKGRVLQRITSHVRALRGLDGLELRKNHHDWILRNVLVDSRGVDYVVDFDSLRAPPSSRWHEVGCLLLNIESQAKWSPLITAPMLSALWDCFWKGYARGGTPECSAEQVGALLYLVRLCHLLGGTFRAPLFEKHTRLVDRRFLRAVKEGVLAGWYTTLDWTVWPGVSGQ